MAETFTTSKGRRMVQPERPSVKAPTQEPGESYESYKKKLEAFKAEQKKAQEAAPAPKSLGDVAKEEAEKKKKAAAEAQKKVLKDQ